MPSTTVKLPAGSGGGGVLAAGVSGTVVYPGQDAVSHDELMQRLSGFAPLDSPALTGAPTINGAPIGTGGSTQTGSLSAAGTTGYWS